MGKMPDPIHVGSGGGEGDSLIGENKRSLSNLGSSISIRRKDAERGYRDRGGAEGRPWLREGKHTPLKRKRALSCLRKQVW